MARGKAKFAPTVEQWPIEDLIPYENNAKIHTEDQIARLSAQIKKVGWDVPIVVDSRGSIIKGHGRRLAAMQLGLKTVPVIVRRDLSPEDVDAARLSDNRVAMGDYDTDLLQSELLKLAGADYEMSSMGFDEKELSFLTEDPFGDMDHNAFADDTTDKQAAALAPPEKVAVGRALGFTHITVESVPEIKAFMAMIEADCKLEGEEALVYHIQSVMTNK